MPRERIELSWGCPHRFLRPARKPVPPPRRDRFPLYGGVPRGVNLWYSRLMSVNRICHFYPQAIRDRAIQLRRKGYSLYELRGMLGVRLATVQGWVKSVRLSREAKERIRRRIVEGGKAGRAKAVVVNRQKVEVWKQRIRRESLNLVQRIPLDSSLGKLFCGLLYICEGSRYPSSRVLGFGNSDPRLIRLFLHLLRHYFRIEERKFRCQIPHRCDQSWDSLAHYWSQVTGIPKRQFYKTKPDLRTIGRPTRRKDYQGVCFIQYLDTTLQLTLQSMGEALMEMVKKIQWSRRDLNPRPLRCHRSALPLRHCPIKISP